LAFWDKVKEFFGGGGPGAPGAPGGGGAPSPVTDAMVARAQKKESFEAKDIAAALLGANPPADAVAKISNEVEVGFQAGVLKPFGYRRLFRDNTWLYNPYTGLNPGEVEAAPPVRFVPPPANPISAPAGQQPLRGPDVAAVKAAAAKPNAYAANPEILGLSAEELRKRAVKVKPWTTAFIGRVDLIPPQSDERTAYIDRGLVLRGLLTNEQLAEIHTVGDQWLRHKDASSLATALAKKSAQAALDLARAEKEAKKKELKAAAEKKWAERAAAIAERKKTDIVFLGQGVSYGLHDRRANVERLKAAGLPVLAAPADVAKVLGVTVPQLRWLCFHSEAASSSHYIHFSIPKRSGGERRIAAPKKKLATAQRWVLDNVLAKVPTEAPAHGFVKGRSTVSNAKEHLGRGQVVNLDLKDFFPTITFRRVRGVFTRMGYSPAAATVLALICTEAPRTQVTYEGKPVFVAAGQRALPQGACTSPALSNLIARKLDRRLTKRLGKKGWTYTRYADDLTFSAAKATRGDVGMAMAVVRHVAQDEGFQLNPKKGRVQPRASRQLVTGIVVNTKPGVPRDQVRRIRAILHQAKKTGLEAQNREKRPHFKAYLKGLIAYVHMVDPAKGSKLLAQLEALKD
jgi:retron-type reverse transcriptase